MPHQRYKYSNVNIALLLDDTILGTRAALSLDMANVQHGGESTKSSASAHDSNSASQSSDWGDKSLRELMNTTLDASNLNPRRCGNCGQRHGLSGESQHPNCFYITVRRSGRRPISPLFEAQAFQDCQRLPRDTNELEAIRDSIWEEFEAIIAENDLERALVRQNSVGNSYGKGAMKQKAPIPWLKWTAPDGQSGQTRKRENFVQLWEQIVLGDETFLAGATMWLNCVLLHPTAASFSDEEAEIKEEIALK